MRKRTSQPVAVLTICLLFLGPLASGLLAADTGTTIQTTDPTLITKAPSQVLLALFPFLIDFLRNSQPNQATADNAVPTIRPTGTIKSIRLSGAD